LTNLLLHCANGIVFMVLLQRLGIPGAWFAAALFCLHPLNVESVAWVTERKNVLSLLFYLLCVLSYLRFAFSEKPSSLLREDEVWRWRPYAVAMLFYICALLCKTVVATLPAALLILLWWKKDKLRKADLLPLVPFLSLGAVFGFVTVWIEKHHVGASGVDWSLPFLGKCLLAGRILWFYLWKFVWPENLIFFYERWKIDPSVWWQYLYPALALGALVVLWIMRSRLGRAPFAAAAIYAVTLFPALGFFDVYPMLYSYVADHFSYHALLPVFAVLAAGCVQLATRSTLPRPGPAIIAGGLLLLVGTLTWRQCHVYENLWTLYGDILEKNPTAWAAHNNIGNLYFDARNEKKAGEHYREALRLYPANAEAHSNLGRVYNVDRRFEDAEKEFRTALKIRPDYCEANYSLGWALANLGKCDEAEKHFREAARARPHDPVVQCSFATGMEMCGRIAEAESIYKLVLQLQPGFPVAVESLARIERKRRENAYPK
ncbi:MAG: tetratricopeptide repeat protein, partial [Candidatus Sumerlaeaceae bacterium]|nr:tetratricopeptide repeat protein [Candidatus Sumerlaeaceae bacterium]